MLWKIIYILMCLWLLGLIGGIGGLLIHTLLAIAALMAIYHLIAYRHAEL